MPTRNFGEVSVFHILKLLLKQKINVNKDIPGNTPANPSAFSINSSIGIPEVEEPSPSNADDGYMFVPIPSLLPVSFPMASWSPT
jgi:hypothetical protein